MKFFKKPSVIISILIIAAVSVLLYWRYGRPGAPLYDTVTVSRHSIFQEVSVTGRVKPAEDVNLAFERGGKVSKVNVKVGEMATIGQALVELDTKELATDLRKAEAALKSAEALSAQYEAALEAQRAKLDELKRGTRPEELAVAETKVLSAKQILADAETDLANIEHQADIDLANFYVNVPNILNDALAKTDDAVTKQTDEFFSDDNTNPRLTFVTANSQAQIDVERQRLEMTAMLASFRADLSSLSVGRTELDAAMNQAISRLISARDFLTRLTDTVNTSTSLSQTTVTTYKGYLNTARTNVNTAITSVSSGQQSIASKKAANKDSIDSARAKVSQAQNSLVMAEDELVLKRAGATTEQLKAKEAEVRQAEANLRAQVAAVSQASAALDNLSAQLDKTVLKSPINGIVTKQEAEVGEIITASVSIVSIISSANFAIEADVPEADIAKIGVGALADVTLDAYGDDVIFKAAVSAIDPAEKIIEGVATYKITLQFSNGDSRIKSGMTANVEVVGGRRDNVLAVPQRTVAVKDGRKTVQVMNDDASILEVPVKTGLRGSDGYIEILEGLKEGDKVIVATKTK